MLNDISENDTKRKDDQSFKLIGNFFNKRKLQVNQYLYIVWFKKKVFLRKKTSSEYRKFNKTF